MEIVKAKETFPSVIQPKGKKPLGRNSFIIRLYLGSTYASINTPLNVCWLGHLMQTNNGFP